jgi:hypothetical protein
VKLSYDAILKGIQFVLDHKDEITAAVKEGKDLIDWLREKFGAHEGLTAVERALLMNAIDELANLANEGGVPPLTPPPAPPQNDPWQYDAPASDPTTVAYDSIDEAEKHLTTYYNIIIDVAGKFYVWPGSLPHVGTKVYPPEDAH